MYSSERYKFRTALFRSPTCASVTSTGSRRNLSWKRRDGSAARGSRASSASSATMHAGRWVRDRDGGEMWERSLTCAGCDGVGNQLACGQIAAYDGTLP